MPHNPTSAHESPDFGLHDLAEPPVQCVLAPPIVRRTVAPVNISCDGTDTRSLWQRLQSRFAEDAIGGGISLVVHMIALIILALVALVAGRGGSA